MMSDVIRFLKKSSKMMIVTHNDADGITSGVILYKTLVRLGKNTIIYSLPYQTENGLKKIFLHAKNKRDIIFIDMGSTYGEWIKKYAKTRVAVIDHHPLRGETPPVYWIPASEENKNTIKYATAATLAAAIAREFGVLDGELLWWSIVGATGDMADITGRFEEGLIRDLIDWGVEQGYIGVKEGLRLPGKFALSSPEIIENSFLPPIDEHVDLTELPRGDPEQVLTRGVLEKVYGDHVDMAYGEVIYSNIMPVRCLTENHDAYYAISKANPLSKDTIAMILRGDYRAICERAHKRILEEYEMYKKTIDDIMRKHYYIITDKAIIVYNPNDALSVGTLANYFANKNALYFGRPELPVIVYSRNTKSYHVGARIHYDYQYTVDLGKLMNEAVEGIRGASGGGHPVAAGATLPLRERALINFLSYFV